MMSNLMDGVEIFLKNAIWFNEVRKYEKTVGYI